MKSFRKQNPLLTFALLGFLLMLATSAHAATFTVSNTNDSGAGSLRQAITNANASAGVFDTIHFNIPGSGVRTINLVTQLPTITDPLNLDGTSQPGFSGTPLIELNGALVAVEGAHGLRIIGGNCDIRSLVINRFDGPGILIDNKGGNFIVGNYLGVSPSGTLDLGNGYGIVIYSSNNTIGGSDPAWRNVISGNNQTGISIVNATTTGNMVRGNRIGTNAAGTAALPNHIGIYIASPGNTIGGTNPGFGNLISGNSYEAILLNGASANGNVVQGNYIGTNVNGNVALGNTEHGLRIDGAPNNIIGGAAAGAANVISGTISGPGILVYNAGAINNQIKGNFIGSDKTGSNPVPNSGSGIQMAQNPSGNQIGGPLNGEGNVIAFNGGAGIRILDFGVGNTLLGNKIFANGSLGIDLGALFGVTPNDADDLDTGANDLQNFPILSYVGRDLSSTLFSGTLNSKPNTEYRVEFFHTATCDPSGHGQGRTYLGAAPSIITNGSGNANINVTIPLALPPVGAFVTATATDSSGNTSEFSPCKVVNSLAAGYFAFVFANYDGSEGSGTAMITVARGGTGGSIASVNFATSNGTAEAGPDYAPNSGVLTFGIGEMTKTFPVNVLNDIYDEPNETVVLTLSNPTNGSVLSSPSTATLTIADQNAPSSLSISDVSVTEGNSGTKNATFNATLNLASGHIVTVVYTTTNGTATPGSDFETQSNVVTFNPGETSKPINIVIKGDPDIEGDETFFVNLSNANNANIADAVGQGTIINDDASTGATVQFSQATFTVSEQLGAVTVTVTRSGDTTGSVSVDYATVDATAIQKNDYGITSGTLNFAAGEVSKTIEVLINEDVYIEGNESLSVVLSNPLGTALGTQNSASVTITDDAVEGSANPIDDPQSFVHMHYHDFLNREPDAGGLQFWTNEITACGTNPQCVESKRINVSAAYFLSIEFQQTGYLLYLMQKESFNSLPKYASFMRDLQELSQGVVVGSAGWQQKLALNQQQLADKWASRPEFRAVYDPMSNTAFVNTLYANAGVVPSDLERNGLIAALDSMTLTRGAALLEVANNSVLRQQERNPAFVLMQYFGYLRRDPDSGPDTDLSGFFFWLNKLNAANGDFQAAEMVKAFLNSIEYRQRFAQ